MLRVLFFYCLATEQEDISLPKKTAEKSVIDIKTLLKQFVIDLAR
jgi:hypothetical protein